MRFDRVRLANFKPFEDTDLRLDDGVTVIHGLNGSGKSSLLEACFFALYGSKALDGTLDDVMTNGAEETEVELWFTHDGGSYHVERRLRQSGDRTQTATCVLEGPEGTVEGARDVRRFVTDLLRMDAEAFVNCAYVRQGEVNKLINASPSDRQDMIDDLLQLGRLEEYRERAAQARLGVEDVLTGQEAKLEDKEDAVDDLESQDLHARLNAVESDLTEVDAEIERYESQREKAKETRDAAEETLETYEETREELAAVEADIADLRETIEADEQKRDDLREEMREVRDRRDDLREDVNDRLADLDVSDAEDLDAAVEAARERLSEAESDRADLQTKVQMFDNQVDALTERAEELSERAESARAEAEELDEAAAEAAATADDRRETLADLADDVAAHREAFADAPVDFGDAAAWREELVDERESVRDDLTDARADLQSARERVEDTERLLEAGKCPECGQPVEGVPHVEGIEADRDRVADLESRCAELDARLDELDDAIERADALREHERAVERLRTERETVEARVEDAASTAAEKREAAAEKRETADELASQAAEKREAAAEMAEKRDDARERLDEREAETERLDSRVDALESVREKRRERERLDDELDRLREKRESLAAVNDERRDRLQEKRERRDELDDAVDEDALERARERRANAEEYLERVAEELDRLAERRDELVGKRERTRADIDRLESLRAERDAVRTRVESLRSLHAETTELEAMYGDLRSDLRQRNVETLERMLNETFDLVYGNDAYARIRLDGDYSLTVVQKDGETLDPEQLSGGERALFNLSLRCAIYRLLAEGIDGAAPMPPLILDEPTVFLDSGHVSRLVDLVEEMRTLGVRQSVIVSHDEELVGAADDLVSVEKDSTTNRSSVRRERTPTSLAASAND